MPRNCPRVTFLRERFGENGVESDRTVENPETFLAPLPSSRTISSEIEWIRRSSSDLVLISIINEWIRLI